MSSLVRSIQHNILNCGSPEELRLLLVALAIPANQPQQADAFERVRKCILYSGATEAELRSAFGDLGLVGGGTDPRGGLRGIRKALLRNL